MNKYLMFEERQEGGKTNRGSSELSSIGERIFLYFLTIYVRGVVCMYRTLSMMLSVCLSVCLSTRISVCLSAL